MKVLYVKNGHSTFIRLDEEILSAHFPTRSLYLNNTGRYIYFFELIKLVIFLVLLMPFHTIAYTRFADWHAAIMAWFCRLYGKKFAVVVGGYDATHFPEFKYGVYDRRQRGKWARYALRNANMVLPNNPTLIGYINHYMPGISRLGGIKHFVPEMRGEIRVVYNGYHTGFWVPAPEKKIPGRVMTVAYVGNHRNYLMKGVDDFILAARSMPELTFQLVGVTTEKLEEWAGKLPGNLHVAGSLNRAELLTEYQRTSVFCLLSLSEGMPNVLCEAMLCECVPVVSDVNYNARLVADCGIIIREKDPVLIVEAIRKAIRSGREKGKMARQAIVENYPFERREKALVEIIRELAGKT